VGGGGGRAGGEVRMRGVGMSRAPGARSGVGAVGGRGQTGPCAHFCGGICVLNSSSCDIDVTELRDVPHASLRRRVARWGEPLSRLSWRGRVRSSIQARAVFHGTTLDVAHSAGPRPSSPRLSPVDGIDRGSPSHRTRAPVLPLTRVPRPCTPWSLSIHRKGTSQL
jgi:hypothetical protein